MLAFEASELGLAVGEWPAIITVDGATARRIACKRDADRDIVYVRYVTDAGVSVRVFND